MVLPLLQKKGSKRIEQPQERHGHFVPTMPYKIVSVEMAIVLRAVGIGVAIGVVNGPNGADEVV